jgi:hypothetical protein
MLSSSQNGTANPVGLDPQPNQVEYSTQYQLEQRPPPLLPFRSTELSNSIDFAHHDQPISSTAVWTQNPNLYDQSNIRYPPPGRVQTIDAIPTTRSRESSMAVSQASNSSESPLSTPISTPSSDPSPFLGPEPGASPQGEWCISPIGVASPISRARSSRGSLGQNNISPRLESISQPSPRSFHLDRRIPVTL